MELVISCFVSVCLGFFSFVCLLGVFVCLFVCLFCLLYFYLPFSLFKFMKNPILNKDNFP